MNDCQAIHKTPIDIKYYNTSVKKLILLSVCTFGIYEIYWHYRNWKAIKDQAGEKINPILRAFFLIIFSYDLFKKMNVSIKNKGFNVTYSAGQLATSYILLILSGKVASRYNGPLTNLLFVVSFFTVIPLVIMQKAVNLYNASLENSYKINGVFSWKSIIVIVLGGVLLILSIWGLFLPSSN